MVWGQSKQIYMKAKLTNGAITFLPEGVTLDTINAAYLRDIEEAGVGDDVIKGIKLNPKPTEYDNTLLLIREAIDAMHIAKVKDFKLYKEYVKKYKGELGDNQEWSMELYETETEIVCMNTPVFTPEGIMAEMNEVKRELQRYDYKIIKATENIIMGEELSDSSLKALVIERRKLRDHYNELEEKIK